MIQWEEREPDRVRLRVSAKINPYLRIVRRRPDGYHEIELVLHSVSLDDQLDVTLADELEVTCDQPHVPGGPSNLAWQAAAMLRESASDTPLCNPRSPLNTHHSSLTECRGARIHIRKRIPVGAGMGGGSADAAATLLALDSLWKTGKTQQELHDLAARLGSDVPFFLTGGTQVGSGRGEELRPVSAPALWLVLVNPPFPVSTGWAYSAWQREDRHDTTIGRFLDVYAAGDPASIGPLLRNDLESGVSRGYPAIEAIRLALLDAGALGARMTGSGSVVFGICQDESDARRIAASLDDSLGQAEVVQTKSTNAPVG